MLRVSQLASFCLTSALSTLSDFVSKKNQLRYVKTVYLTIRTNRRSGHDIMAKKLIDSLIVKKSIYDRD